MLKQATLWTLALVVGLLLSEGTTRAQVLPTLRYNPTGAAAAAPTMMAVEGSASRFHLLPVRNQKDGVAFFGDANLSTLRTVLLSGTTDRGSLYVELLGDILPGGIRLALGSAVSSSRQDDAMKAAQASDAQKFFGGGGNGILSAAYPVAGIYKEDSINRLVLLALPKLSGNLPGIGASPSKATGNTDLGFELHGQVTTAQKLLTLVGQVRGAWVAGTNDFGATFGNHNTFFYAQWLAAVRLAETYQIGVSGIFAQADVKNAFGTVMISATVTPPLAPQ